MFKELVSGSLKFSFEIKFIYHICMGIHPDTRMSEQDVTLSLVHAVAGHHLANLQISPKTEIQKL